MFVRQTIRFSLACLILPNLPFWVLGRLSATTSRGLFNIEYLGWGCVALFAPRVAVVIGLCISFLFEVAYAFAPIFYFRQSDLVSAARFVPVFPWPRIVALGFMLLLASLAWAFVISRFFALQHKRNRAETAAILVAGMLILAGTDLRGGTNALVQFSDHRSSINLATSTVVRLVKSTHDLLRTPDSPAVYRPVESATRAVSAFQTSARGTSRQNAVLIIVESYGLALDLTSSELFKAPFLAPSLAEKYRVEFGTVPFEGATVSAEMRELCGISSGINVSAEYPLIANCLPQAMKANGYHTIAIHGFDGSLFDRRDWYPKLGFDEIYFREQLAEKSRFASCNGPFPGICDDAIAEQIGAYLAGSGKQPQFIYWVTLNSHLPIEHLEAADSALGCRSNQAPVQDADVCGLMALLYKTNLAIARAAGRPDLPPTEFLVVGDHAPPFISSRRRNLFSQRVVPYAHLTPEQQTARGPALHARTAFRP